MSKTITEVRKAKKELEAKIAQMLLEFEEENEVQISSCYCNSYDEQCMNDALQFVRSKHKVDFSISVML